MKNEAVQGICYQLAKSWNIYELSCDCWIFRIWVFRIFVIESRSPIIKSAYFFSIFCKDLSGKTDENESYSNNSNESSVSNENLKHEAEHNGKKLPQIAKMLTIFWIFWLFKNILYSLNILIYSRSLVKKFANFFSIFYTDFLGKTYEKFWIF